MFHLEKLIIEEKVRSNITFREARQKIYNTNQQLTSQIPRLNTSPPKNSYSSSSSPSHSIPSEIQNTLVQQQHQISLLTKQIQHLIHFIRDPHHSLPVPGTDSDMDTGMPHITPVTSRNERYRKVGEVKRRKRESRGVYPDDSSQSDRSSPKRKSANQTVNQSVPSSEGTSSSRPEDPSRPGFSAPSLEGNASSPEGATSNISDPPSQLGQATNAEMGDSTPLVESSGGKSTVEEKGGSGRSGSQNGKHSADSKPRTGPSPGSSKLPTPSNKQNSSKNPNHNKQKPSKQNAGITPVLAPK